MDQAIPTDQRELEQLRQNVEKERCQRDLYYFVQKAWQHIVPRPYSDNWHVKAISDHLRAAKEGKFRRLIVNVPPGTSKSIVTCVMFPAWTWTTQPEKRFFFASYSDQLTIRDSVYTRQLLDSPWYQKNWGKVFSFSSDQNLKHYFENSKGGYRIASSVGGAGLGSHPDYIVIDDPLKPDEALSEVASQNVIDWFDGTVSTRGAAADIQSSIILIMQRLSQMDLAEHLLKNKTYVHLCLPMRYEPPVEKLKEDDKGELVPVIEKRMEPTPIGFQDPREEKWKETGVEGELLDPKRFPEDTVIELEQNLRHQAAGQLQQRPSPKEGSIFKSSWFLYWSHQIDRNNIHSIDPNYYVLQGKHGRTVVAVKECTHFGTVDLALTEKKQNDPSVIACWALTPFAQLVLLDVYRDWVQAPEVLRQIQRHFQKWNMEWIGIERVQYQESMVQFARLQNITARSIPAKGDKIGRADTASIRVEAGQVFFREGARWLSVIEDELVNFPNGAHDDFTDTLSYACIHAGRVGEISVPESPPLLLSRDEWEQKMMAMGLDD